MAQGLDVRSLSSAKSPTMDTKSSGDSVKRARGMGSRRIFSPQFKIQVLDSYRNDVDCRGNQRATARKYNIHRRQIQKWLQCEQNLRTTVEESVGKSEAGDFPGSKSRKKTDTEDGANSTLNESAMVAAAARRLGDGGGPENEKPFRTEGYRGQDTRARMYLAAEELRLEARNLKRVAQRLYPSLQNIPCRIEDKIGESECAVAAAAAAQAETTTTAQNYFPEFGLRSSDSRDAARDDNYNRIRRTNEEEPLDLKNKVRSESLPEDEFLSSNVDGTLPENVSDKLRIRVGDKCQSGLTSPTENVGGPKLPASNATRKCPTRKYNMGDIESRSRDSQNEDESLFPRSVNGAESSSLPNVPVPETSASLSASTLSSSSSSEPQACSKRKMDGDDESCSLSSCGEFSLKKSKTESNSESIKNGGAQRESAKSFNPKRKWIEESMQEMMMEEEEEEEGGRDQVHEPSSLPIKQRVKINLRSLPEGRQKEDLSRSNGVSTNFTIEKLCSPDPFKVESSDCYGRRRSFYGINASDAPFGFPPPLIISNRVISDANSFHLKPEIYNGEGRVGLGAYDYSLNLPLKEEIMSDGEDVDVDIMSTTPAEKKSFDFSGYNFGKRRSFSVQFKLTVLDAFYNDKDCNKNQRATARKFNINRRQVQKWLSQENDLRSESSLKNSKYLQRQKVEGNAAREGEECTGCPQHCLRKTENLYGFGNTIEVNVKSCTDRECLSGIGRGKDRFDLEHLKTSFTSGLDFYGRTLFPDPKAESYYQGYLYPENNNMVYQDSILGWSHLNSSALTVPNFQCLSTWHRGFDYCQEKPKIY